MRFDVQIQKGAGRDGWDVTVADDQGEAPPGLAVRPLEQVGAGPRAFPLPPKDAAPEDAIAPAELHYEFCNAQNPKALSDCFQRLLARRPDRARMDVERFGRYLFATLLGKTSWKAIVARAEGKGAARIELALRWAPGDDAIARLPWEMMHGPGSLFLAQQVKPRVAVTRRVRSEGTPPAAITSPPRVLFCVGRAIDEVIRPGAEYVGLLRELRRADLEVGLRHHLLLNTSVKRLEVALRCFRPTVVHLICHGRIANDACLLRLVDDQNDEADVDVPASSLAGCFREAGVTPQIVVLNACYSGAVPNALDRFGAVSTPLAEHLVVGGVPIVVGMAGPAADRACRLFTRQFYRALLGGGDVAHAAAEGRRAGLLAYGGFDPKATIDWAFPALFLAAGLGEIKLEDVRDDERKRQKIASSYFTFKHPAYCDRLGVLRWLDVLLVDSEDQTKLAKLEKEKPVAALAIKVKVPDSPGGYADRLGRSWLLHMMAAQAASQGHIPCLVSNWKYNPPSIVDWPKDRSALVPKIWEAAKTTARRFEVGLTWTPALLKPLQAGDPPPAGLPQDVAKVYQESGHDPADPAVLARAVRSALLDLRQAVLKKRRDECPKASEAESGRAKLLLLVDDVHRMDLDAADFLLAQLLEAELGQAPEARTVFTYSSEPLESQKAAAAVINNCVAMDWVKEIHLEPFPSIEDRLAYQHFLLNWREKNQKGGKPLPLCFVAGADEAKVKNFFERFHARTKGVPSRLDREEVTTLVSETLEESWIQAFGPLLAEADDERLLELEHQLQGDQA